MSSLFRCFGLFGKKKKPEMVITAPIQISSPQISFDASTATPRQSIKSPRLNNDGNHHDSIFPSAWSPPPRYDANSTHSRKASISSIPKPSFEEPLETPKKVRFSTSSNGSNASRSSRSRQRPRMPEELNFDTTPRGRRSRRSPKEEAIFSPVHPTFQLEVEEYTEGEEDEEVKPLTRTVGSISRRLKRRIPHSPRPESATPVPPTPVEPAFRFSPSPSPEQILAKQISRNNRINAAVLGNSIPAGLVQAVAANHRALERQAASIRRETSFYNEAGEAKGEEVKQQQENKVPEPLQPMQQRKQDKELLKRCLSPLKTSFNLRIDESRLKVEDATPLEVSPQAAKDVPWRWTRDNFDGLADKDQAWML